jgi:pyruvate dehydrogenase E2 component (dihydrolipoamide acetyltransferase)
MPEIVMPKLSDSMEQGTILAWLKHTGDAVEIGDELAEIEADKSTVTYASEHAGALETLIEEGGTVEVGAPIARIGSPAVSPQPVAPAPQPEPVTRAPQPQRVPAAAELKAIVATNGNGGGERSAGTPLARRAAALHGVDLGNVRGTGPLGRVTRGDVLRSAGLAVLPAALPATPAAPAASAAPAAPASRALAPGSRRQVLSGLQRLIARRMAEAKATVPHFQVQTEVTMDQVISFRAALKPLATDDTPAPSLNDIIIKAAALALREHPLANGSYQDDGFVLHDQINVGVAVAADEALVVPTVFEADRKSLGQIAGETRVLAGRVRDGQIAPAELEGGTFTVSNLGMFGMTAISPVINPPQAAILGVGSLRQTLARIDGEIVDRTLMTLTLSCDHRILYGADAARFLARIRELLEVPLRMAL